MGFFTSAKNAAIKTKVRGEIVFLDREITTRQKALGVELYNLLVVTDTTIAGVKTPSMFHSLQSQIQEPFDSCRSDICLLMNDKDSKEHEIVHIEANRERSRPSRDNQEALAKAGNWLSETGTEAKLQVQIKKLERDMKLRKEQFGVEVFQVLDGITEAPKDGKGSTTGVLGKIKGGGKQAKSGIAARISKMSKSEKEIQACIDNARNDIATLEHRKDIKLREIARLDKES